MELKKAVILAAGLGTRMRQASEASGLTSEQAKMAESGVKALIPIGGSNRPFLDYVLTALSDVGYKHVCLVIGPDHQQIRDYYINKAPAENIVIEFAVQQKPLGTANAVASAEKFAGHDDFIVINSDNYYLPEALYSLRTLNGPGLAVFERDAMIQGSNIPADRISKFAAVEIDSRGCMTKIHEKPTDEILNRLGNPIYCSMNCWRFTPKLFEACRKIPLSPRGEYEITDASQYCIDVLKESFVAQKHKLPVLDLSSRGDISSVADRLRGIKVRY